MQAEQQERRPSISIDGRAHNIAGQRFGELEAIRPVQRSSRGIAWELRCDCGRLAIRTVKTLHRSKKDGYISCCRLCHIEILGGHSEQRSRKWAKRREDNRERYRMLWRETGTLYSTGALERMADDIAADLHELTGIVPDDVDETRARRQIEMFGVIHSMPAWQPPSHSSESTKPNSKPLKHQLTAKEYSEAIDRMRGWLATGRHTDRQHDAAQRVAYQAIARGILARYVKNTTNR